MLRNVLLLAAVSAGTILASNHTYKVTLAQNSVVNGHELQPGTYKVEINNNTAVIRHGKQSIQVPAHEVTAPNKFDNTEVEYIGNIMQKIDFGGTNVSLVFDSGNGGGSAGGAQ
jgi:hypothetical protein